jgi:hypothetical protein
MLMERKRVLFGLFFTIVFLSFFGFASFVSATPDFAGQISNFAGQISSAILNIIQQIKPLLEAILGNVDRVGSIDASQMFFAKVLIFILLVSLIWSVVKTISFFNSSRWAIWAISLGIPLLGVRFLTPQIILFMIWPNASLGVILATFLPLLILFFFIERGLPSKTLRKSAWILAACIFVGIYFVRFDGIGNLAYIYLIAAGLSIAFLFFDRTIQIWWKRVGAEHAMTAGNYIRYNRLLKEREEAHEAYLGAVKRGDFGASAALKRHMEQLDTALTQAMP